MRRARQVEGPREVQDLVAAHLADTPHSFVVSPEHAGARLDQFLAAQGLPFTRSQLKKHIDDGHVRVGAAVAKPSRKLRAGEAVEFLAPPVGASSLIAEDIPLRVVFEDKYLIAIDKPPGLVVHPAAGHASGTLVNALLHHCTDLAGIGGELRPGIVHRLDRDTSGVMVATKDDQTHEGMSVLFRKKDLDRRYVAIVAPPPKAEEGVVRTMYGRHPIDRKKFSSKIKAGGKRAVTHWRVLERFGTLAALVECRLETGRTHQIRVHMADSGHPVLADKMYGKKPADPWLAGVAEELGRQALHARVLGFVHPRTGEKIALEAPIPDDMARALAALRGRSARP